MRVPVAAHAAYSVEQRQTRQTGGTAPNPDRVHGNIHYPHDSYEGEEEAENLLDRVETYELRHGYRAPRRNVAPRWRRQSSFDYEYDGEDLDEFETEVFGDDDD
jgi:hypothetical protein